MLEDLKKSEEDLLDIPSHGELLGEAILQHTCKLECKQCHFSPCCTTADGPDVASNITN